MVLKRYEAEAPAASSPGATKKSKRKVIVPHRLDCSKFMAPAGGGTVRVKLEACRAFY